MSRSVGEPSHEPGNDMRISREYQHIVDVCQEKVFSSMKLASTMNAPMPSSPADLAGQLAQLVGDTPQKVIATRSGLGSDQVSKILGGATKDPQWTTMVRLLRDGLNVSLDQFAKGRATPQLTPYEKREEYRDLIDTLERMTNEDRRFALDLLGRISAALMRRRTPSLDDLTDEEKVRLAEELSRTSPSRGGGAAGSYSFGRRKGAKEK